MADEAALRARIADLTVALELAIDVLQTLAMDLEAELTEEERAQAIEAAVAAGRAAKAVLGKR